MHGADNDLILIKSLFNLSVVNFLDTSRLDI
jgi:ribonuclease D